MLNKWEQFKRYIFSDAKKNSWLKKIYFWCLSLNFNAKVFGTGADAFLLRSYLERNDYYAENKRSHILFLVGDFALNNSAEEKQLKLKIANLKFPRFILVFGSIAALNLKQKNPKMIQGDCLIPGGNFMLEHLVSLKTTVLKSIKITPEKNQGKYDKME